MKSKRIKHNDLTHYFLADHKDLPAAYLASCEKFFKELSSKRQASSTKPQFRMILKSILKNNS
jgi:hypothetical protein